MLNYPYRQKNPIGNLFSSTSPDYTASQSRLNPKYLPYRPPNINIPSQYTLEPSVSGTLTPKTSRYGYQPKKTQQQSFTQTSSVNPDNDKSKKACSFHTSTKIREPVQKIDMKENRTDRSQRVLKANYPKDITNKELDKEKTFLRQTVANTTVWQLKNYAPPSPIKTPTLNKNKSTHQYTPFRKKGDSDYNQPSDPRNDHKACSTHNSRGNSNLGADPLELPPRQRLTPHKRPSQQDRINQDKLTHSYHVRKDKLMSQTDPVGSFIPLSRNTSSVSVRAKEKEGADLRIQDFELGSCKGEGRFGKVFPAVHKKTGCLVAIKQIKKEDVKLMLDQFVQEIKINIYANHPNIVKMYGFFADRLHFYILMEYMEEGSLYKHIKTQKKLKQSDATAKLYEICDAVNYLHSQEILHRDIKPQNIVLSNGVSKLCDFGWAIYSKERRTTYCGTLDYVCPQILEGQSYDNFVDIWAIGVLAYEMLTGKAPFYHISRKQTMKSIMNCNFSFPSEMSVHAKLFITRALQKKPDQRFTIESLLHDRFLQNCGY